MSVWAALQARLETWLGPRTEPGQVPTATAFTEDLDTVAGPTQPAPQAKEHAKAVARILQSVLLPPVERLTSRGFVATGGMATIEDGHDRGLDRRVAMKLLHPHFQGDPRLVRWFVREAQITGQLDHPNVVPVYEMGRRDDGRLFFTMKFVQGRTLGEIVRARPAGRIGRADLFDLLDVVRNVCNALAFAHSRGVVHRDVKPQNIMVAEFGQVYLMDWGIAKFGTRPDVTPSETGKLPILSLSRDVGLTRASDISGTPGFMAPEQASGKPIDRRSDVFSVGAVLYHGLSGRMPYDGGSAEAALGLAAKCEFTPLDEVLGEDSGVPGSLVRIVHRAMEANPDNRYPNISELESEIVSFMRGGGDFPIVDFAAGENILRQGEMGDRAYIVESGCCEVYRTEGGEKITLNTLGPGDVFGETAILAAAPRTASVVAIEDCSLREVTSEILEEEVATLKPWMQTILRSSAERFRELVAATPETRSGDNR